MKGGKSLEPAFGINTFACFNEAALHEGRKTGKNPDVTSTFTASMRPPFMKGGKPVQAKRLCAKHYASMRPPFMKGGKSAIPKATWQRLCRFNEAALHEGRKTMDARFLTPRERASMRPPFMKGGKAPDFWHNGP